MNPNENLEKRVLALEKWQAERKKTQLTFPLDVNTRRTLDKYYMHIVSSLTTVGGAAGNEFTEFIGQQDALEFLVTENYYIPYTVNVTTNVFTIKAYFEDDQLAFVATTDTAPAPLVVGTDYFVVNATGTGSGTTFQLAATVGGAAINITDDGDGRQFIYSFGF